MSDQPRPGSSSSPGEHRGNSQSLAAELSATAHRVEHAVEETIEHGIEAAERTIVQRFGLGALRLVRGTLKVAFWSLVIAYFAFGALLLATRYVVLPRIDGWRPHIERIAGRALDAQVTIGRIEAGWRGFNPHLALNDVEIMGPGGGEPLALPRVDATVSWLSVTALEPRFTALRVLSPQLSVVRRADGRFAVSGFVLEPGRSDSEGSPALDWLLAQQRVAVRDARIEYRDERRTPALELDLDELNLVMEQSLGAHSFAVLARPTAQISGPLDLRGRFSTGTFARASDIRRWKGQVFAQLDFVDLARLSGFSARALQIDHAHGALRAWVNFEDGEIVRTVADVALQDVTARLAPDLEPLQLESLQGRITQRRWGDVWPVGRGGQEIGLVKTTFQTASGLTFPPLDLKLRRTRAAGGEPQLTEVEASRVDLESLGALLAHVPVPQRLHEALSRHAFRGTLSGLSVNWRGAEPRLADIALKAGFTGLGVAASPAPPDAGERAVGRPGVENLSGTVRMDRGSGTLELSTTDGALVFPGVFAEPRLAVKQLAGSIHWKQGEQLELRAENLRAANDDAEITASGTYRATPEGPGVVDLAGRITRAAANQAFRYIPRMAGTGTREWLQHAIVNGRISDGTWRIKGDLGRFPFHNPADGEFRVAARATDATLDVHPGPPGEAGLRPAPGAVWPLLADIDADLLFERASMTITSQRGRAFNARIEQATARIDDLGHDATLKVRGQASGPLADMVRYANQSPVGRWIGGVTEGAETQGTARLDLRLEIPLAHAENARVTGSVALQNNFIGLAGIPAFARTTGTLNFDERGVRFTNITAGALGGQLRLDAITRPDGAIVFTANGSATPAGLRPVVPSGPAQRLLDRSQGTARYQATVTVHNGTALRIESDLVGLAVDGVAPLRKSAQESLPLRIERTTTATADDWRVQGGRFGAHFERRPDKGQMRLARGVIAVNEAPNLPERGLLVIATLPRLDVDAWTALLGGDGAAAQPVRGAGAGAGTATDFQVDLIALRTDALVFSGHTVSHLTLGASRAADGSYRANIVSDGATGFVTWRPASDPQALGHFTARLSRLVIAANKEREVVDALRAPPKQIPSVEVSVERFQMADMPLGQLELVAQNVGTGANATWHIDRLDITNPDMKLVATGDWAPAAAGAARRTQMKFGLDAFDAGATLARLGFANAMAKGAGRLEGEVGWSGSPLEIDYPSLSGRVSLSVDDGRFLKVDAGNAARLLGLLSLQSLGRTLAADGGNQFAEGFAFTSIRADATVDRGVLTTENFRMNGASAAVLMSGTLDLRNETQQLAIVVLPEIDASTAALALGVANPVLGLGAFLAQLLLKDPLSKAFALQYDVTGSWAEPKVARRSRITPTPETAR